MLIDRGHKVDIACNIEKPINSELIELGCNIYNLNFSRSILDSNNLKVIKQLREILNENSYDVMHTHTPIASIISRIATVGTEQTKVIYTCHGFSFCKGDSKLNWMLFYPIEKFFSRFTDAIITINHEDYEVAKSFHSNVVYKIPGIGVPIEEYKKKPFKFDKDDLFNELGLNENDIVISSVGELSKRKNHQIVIKALKILDDSRIKYLIVGEGNEEKELNKLVKELNLENRVYFLGYRRDVRKILHSSSIFIFPSRREGLGLAGIEAMAAGIPVIASSRHGILEYAINNVTALTCNPDKEYEFANAINIILQDEFKANKLTENAYSVIEKFDINNSLNAMQQFYTENFNIDK